MPSPTGCSRGACSLPAPSCFDDANQLAAALWKQHRNGDVGTELLLELTLLDYCRNRIGLEYEMKYLRPSSVEFHPQGRVCLACSGI